MSNTHENKPVPTPLIKVQAIKKKFANQIRIVLVDFAPTSEFMQIREMLSLGQLKPIGWVPGDQIHHGSRMQKFWLVEVDQEVLWMLAPDNLDFWKQHGFIVQLFVD